MPPWKQTFSPEHKGRFPAQRAGGAGAGRCRCLCAAGCAYGLPKDTPEQAAHKAAVLEKALDAACAVPLEVMEKCAEGVALVEEYAAKGSVMAVSDAGCAAALCKVALQAASLNVFINTKLMADRERAAALDAKTDKTAG